MRWAVCRQGGLTHHSAPWSACELRRAWCASMAGACTRTAAGAASTRCTPSPSHALCSGPSFGACTVGEPLYPAPRHPWVRWAPVLPLPKVRDNLSLSISLRTAQLSLSLDGPHASPSSLAQHCAAASLHSQRGGHPTAGEEHDGALLRGDDASTACGFTRSHADGSDRLCLRCAPPFASTRVFT